MTIYKNYNLTARIGRYTWNITSPLFGKYYVDIQTPFGSRNTPNIPESFDSKESAHTFLTECGFVEV